MRRSSHGEINEADLDGGELLSTAPVPAVPEDHTSWNPTQGQRALKQRFWLRMQDNPLIDRAQITLEAVCQLVGSTTPRNYWTKPGYRDWFLNEGENQERLEGLFQLALAASEEVLLNTDPKAQGARVAMIKTVSELAGYLGKKGPSSGEIKEGKLLSDVGKMDKKQLEAFLQQAGLVVEKRINISYKSDEEEGATKE